MLGFVVVNFDCFSRRLQYVRESMTRFELENQPQILKSLLLEAGMHESMSGIESTETTVNREM